MVGPTYLSTLKEQIYLLDIKKNIEKRLYNRVYFVHD